ncbi:hypothetical protein CEXT_173371 [Caerostris extrusa]|uniref:Uncharacterized protein n=1 Tax=Caerostris extrusa TaxID=172846 RepID=A0AAV4MXR8_CAEEX|nr:hypothetical protein CEXT_173371 [Caerostris extrusa]
MTFCRQGMTTGTKDTLANFRITISVPAVGMSYPFGRIRIQMLHLHIHRGVQHLLSKYCDDQPLFPQLNIAFLSHPIQLLCNKILIVSSTNQEPCTV